MAKQGQTPLDTFLCAQIRASGPMTVAEYMAAALAHPKYGYYRSRDPLGRAGDFITAPEISQTFGELIGLWCAVTWQIMGRPQPASLAELGPGRGTLMKDALRAAERVPEFLAAADVYFVEISPVLKTLQQDALAPYAEKTAKTPRWLEDVGDLPEQPGLIIANEFFDALPVRQFVKTGHGWAERLVSEDNGTLCWAHGEPILADTMIPPSHRDAPEGSIFETSPAAEGVIRQIGELLGEHGGACLIIDYGHTRSAPGETLQALKGHRYHDPLQQPGEADLTCHVDFGALANAARQAGLTVHGPKPQGEFLVGLGIEQRRDALAAENPDRAEELRSAVERLIHPDQMGRLFKAMALSHKDTGALPGFD